ncbi:MAG: hypothetical protein LBK62_02075 [Treponema sp.]|jgi:hypothetical protein|nr:hypothetical protein [Treponema sp.]
MVFSENPVTVSETIAFSAVVDRACDRLMDRQARYSIQRIREMEENLAGLERELDELLSQKNEK